MAVTEVTSTGTNDHLVIQAAHDAASDGDTLQLKQADSSTKFEFGTTGAVTVSKALKFEGINGKPIINGGTGAFTVVAPGKDVEFDTLKFTEVKGHCIWFKQAANCKIDSCDVMNVTSQNLGTPHAFGFGDTLVAFDFGNSPSSAPFIPNAVITGEKIVDNCYIDFETGMDPSDPYAGERNKINPALIANGGSWPGPGYPQPNAWNSEGIFNWYDGGSGDFKVTNCVVKNYSNGGIASADILGRLDVSRNTLDTPYGSHFAAIPWGNAALSGINANAPLPAIFPPLRQNHGHWDIKKNNIVMSGYTNIPIVAFVVPPPTGGPFKPLSCSISKNKIVTSDAMFGIWVEACDLAYVGQNHIRGTGDFGVGFGLTAPVRVFGTDKCAWVGNNVKEFTPNVADLYFTADSAYGIAAGGGLVQETVLNAGYSNTITGYGPAAGTIGSTLQEILDSVRTAPGY